MRIYEGIVHSLCKEAKAPISRFLTGINPLSRAIHAKGLIGRLQREGKGLTSKELKMISEIANVSPEKAGLVAAKASERMGPYASSQRLARFMTNPLGSFGTKLSGGGAAGATVAPMLDFWPIVGGVAGGGLAAPAGLMALTGATRGIGRRALEARIAGGKKLSGTERQVVDLLRGAGKDVRRDELIRRINPLNILK